MASNNVNLGLGRATGMFYHAAAATALPDFPTDTLNNAWKEVGAISEDGITLATNRDLTPLRNWAKAIERLLPAEQGATVQAPIIYTTEESFKALFGASNVTVAAANGTHGKLISVDLAADTLPDKEAYLFIGKDGDDTFMVGTTAGWITSVDDVAFAPDDAITWTATISADTWTIMKDDGQHT